MNNIAYARACTEVLELLRHLPKEEHCKIPESEFEYYEKNKDADYVFELDMSKQLEEQEISIEANSIIISIFKKYFATDRQREKVDQILKSNWVKAEQEKRKKYNPDNIFKNKQKTVRETEVIKIELEKSLIEYKESIWKRLFGWIKFRINR